MLSLRTFSVVLFGALAACASPTAQVAPVVDGGTTASDGKCDNLNGFFQVVTEGADCNSYRASLLPAVCISQNGCELTIDTGTQHLTGRATGRKFTVSATTPVKTECSGEIADENLQMKCTTTVPLAREPYVCDFASVKREGAEETSYCCDPVGQSCASGERCSLLALVSNSDALAAACLPIKGTVGEGEVCQRFGPEAANAGNDDCDVGLFCSRIGVPLNADRLCRKLCAKESECGDGICYAVTQVPVAGFCLPSCDLFGDECGVGTTCRRMTALDERGARVQRPACSGTGAVAVGGGCASDSDCPSSTVCNYQPGDRRTPKCRTLCDAEHGCGSGFRCTAFDAASGDTTGVCVAK
jgi:hypothetical protein